MVRSELPPPPAPLTRTLPQSPLQRRHWHSLCARHKLGAQSRAEPGLPLLCRGRINNIKVLEWPGIGGVMCEALRREPETLTGLHTNVCPYDDGQDSQPPHLPASHTLMTA